MHCAPRSSTEDLQETLRAGTTNMFSCILDLDITWYRYAHCVHTMLWSNACIVISYIYSCGLVQSFGPYRREIAWSRA